MLSQDETHSIVISGNEGSNDSELDHTYAREQHDDCESSGEVVVDADSERVSLQSFKWLIHRLICLSRKCSTPQRMNSKKVYYFEQNEFIWEVVWEVSNASIGLSQKCSTPPMEPEYHETPQAYHFPANELPKVLLPTERNHLGGF